MPGSKTGAALRRANGQYQRGASGNPKGKRAIAGTPSAEVATLARDTSPEAFAIVQSIARDKSADAGERLRAARLWIELGATPEAEKPEDAPLTVSLVNDWRPLKKGTT